jgi:haloacetate dehalogenase
MCEDYRATAGIDFEMDTKDFEAGKRVTLPLLVLWGATGGVGRNSKPEPAEIWKRYATDIRGARSVPSGHYLMEEAPEQTYKELREFFIGGEL